MSPGRSAAVVLGALVLQVCLFSQFSYEGARPDIMILVAIVAGYLLGPERGAILGFAAGMSFDIVLTTPLGLSALTYTLVAYAVGLATSGLVRVSRWATPIIATAGSLGGVLLYAVIGAVLGEPTLEGPALPAILVYVAVINAVFSPLAARAVGWVRPEDHDRRHTFLAR